MNGICIFLALATAASAQPVANPRDAATAAASHGQWRDAELLQRQALAACHTCPPGRRATLRAELAGYLTLGGFPEAAIAVWKQSLAELPAGSAERLSAHIGLGVAYFAAGRPADAEKAWKHACLQASADPYAHAACRFNVAVSRMEREPVWSELEAVLPTLLDGPGAIQHATALLQTAAAALTAGRLDRAAELLSRTESAISAELAPQHPFLAEVYRLRAQLAAARRDPREARLWRKKAAAVPAPQSWDRGVVSVEQLKEKPRP